jgi:hypothetical protein
VFGVESEGMEMVDSLKADVRFNIENEDEQKHVNLILSKRYVVGPAKFI